MLSKRLRPLVPLCVPIRTDDSRRQANVWDTKGKDSADSAWQLGDKMSFKWQHWEDDSHEQDSTSKALKEVNVWDNAKARLRARPLFVHFFGPPLQSSFFSCHFAANLRVCLQRSFRMPCASYRRWGRCRRILKPSTLFLHPKSVCSNPSSLRAHPLHSAARCAVAAALPSERVQVVGDSGVGGRRRQRAQPAGRREERADGLQVPQLLALDARPRQQRDAQAALGLASRWAQRQAPRPFTFRAKGQPPTDRGFLARVCVWSGAMPRHRVCVWSGAMLRHRFAVLRCAG